jgi:hypothetical protein
LVHVVLCGAGLSWHAGGEKGGLAASTVPGARPVGPRPRKKKEGKREREGKKERRKEKEKRKKEMEEKEK